MLNQVNGADALTNGAQEHNDQENIFVVGEATAEVVRGDHDAEQTGYIEEQGDSLKVLEVITTKLDHVCQALAHIN